MSKRRQITSQCVTDVDRKKMCLNLLFNARYSKLSWLLAFYDIVVKVIITECCNMH